MCKRFSFLCRAWHLVLAVERACNFKHQNRSLKSWLCHHKNSPGFVIQKSARAASKSTVRFNDTISGTWTLQIWASNLACSEIVNAGCPQLYLPEYIDGHAVQSISCERGVMNHQISHGVFDYLETILNPSHVAGWILLVACDANYVCWSGWKHEEWT